MKADPLKKQREFEESFRTWFDVKAKPIIEDCRRRYRMQLEDAQERKDRGLSALASTKSTSAVDRAVEKAILEYHGEPDAISFTARMGGELDTEMRAKWLTEVFKYRSEHTFPFALFNIASLTAGFTDGLEAALCSWRKESYTVKEKVYHFSPDGVTMEPVPEEVYLANYLLDPRFHEMEEEREVKVKDTFWVDQLKPGEDLLWDIKAPLLNLEMGQAHLVKVAKTMDEIIGLSEMGVFDKITPEKLRGYQGEKTDTTRHDSTATAGDVDDFDFGDLNRIEVWLWFEKVEAQWQVSFSVEGRLSLSKPKPVNDVFFNGRPVNILPIFLGTSKLKLHEGLGRGLPETIAPIEDEWTDHRNNLNDAAKMAIQGRWRIDENSDVDIDSLLNERVFYARQGEVDRIVEEYNIAGSLRAVDAITSDFNELVPVGIENRQVLPRGTDKTLGAVQLAIGSGNEKLSVALMVRNITFFRPLLHCIAQMIIAWETDETILRIAGGKVKQEGQGWQPPTVGDQVDIRALDLEVDVQINAGLGAIPRQQKTNTIIQLVTMGAQAGIPVDMVKAFKQISVLAGFDEDTFLSQEEPKLPQPEMKGTLNIDVALLPPELQMPLVMAFLQGGQQLNANFKAAMPPPQEIGAAVTGEPDDMAGAMGTEMIDG